MRGLDVFVNSSGISRAFTVVDGEARGGGRLDPAAAWTSGIDGVIGQLLSTDTQGRLALDLQGTAELLEKKAPLLRNFALKRLKMLFSSYSRGVRSGEIALDSIRRLARFCLELIPVIEEELIVLPTPRECAELFGWYLRSLPHDITKPLIVLTTVCPDYPYDFIGGKAVFNGGVVANGVGLVGEGIVSGAPRLLRVLTRTLGISVVWAIGYAGFEGSASNLEKMGISEVDFRSKLQASAQKLRHRLGVEVGILPDALGFTEEQFLAIKSSFQHNDFEYSRDGMEALSDAVDTRDWATVYWMANKLNAIIIDGASVYMGRRAYRKAKALIGSARDTPAFYCQNNYVGFD